MHNQGPNRQEKDWNTKSATAMENRKWEKTRCKQNSTGERRKRAPQKVGGRNLERVLRWIAGNIFRCAVCALLSLVTPPQPTQERDTETERERGKKLNTNPHKLTTHDREQAEFMVSSGSRGGQLTPGLVVRFYFMLISHLCSRSILVQV